MEIATYKYQYRTGVYPVQVFESFELKVEVLEEVKGGRLRVRFLGYHADKRAPGSITTVHAKSVKRTAKKQAEDLADKLKDAPPSEDIRKPYKD